MLKLIGTDGSRFYKFDLEPGSYTIGRASDLPFSVPDKTVSRKHATVEVSASGDEIYVTDLGSRNGTTLNGVRISSRSLLKLGDRIMFGRTEFKLKDANSEDSKIVQPTAALLSSNDPEKSVVMPISEALSSLPSKVSDLPALFPTLSEMARMHVASEPKEVMLERALELVNKVIPAERLAILMTAEDGGDVYVAASLLSSGKDHGSFSLSKTIINDILTNKSAILLGDPSQDPRFAKQESIIMSEIRSAMAVPLFDEDKVLGILYIDSRHPLHRYNDDYLRLLATFGNIIAARLLNYALVTEREEKKVFAAELERASHIQKNLLIREQPEVSGYDIHAYQQQCRAVGGDLYDIAILPGGELVLLVADVSGKGMGAALLMANILASFRILYGTVEFTLEQVIEMVSTQLFKSSAPADFATMFIGVLNPKNNKISYINAGHNPPLLLRQDGSMEKLDPCGVMIGAFPDMSWTKSEKIMETGDMLLVFTDGVTEAEREDEQYGDQRLEKIFSDHQKSSSSTLLNEIMNDIENYLSGAPRTDDITMLSLKRNS